MEKDELMRRAQHDHRKGDERERWLQQKVLHDVSGVTTLAMLIIGLLSWFGAIGGQITVFGAHCPLTCCSSCWPASLRSSMMS